MSNKASNWRTSKAKKPICIIVYYFPSLHYLTITNWVITHKSRSLAPTQVSTVTYSLILSYVQQEWKPLYPGSLRDLDINFNKDNQSI